MPRIIAYTYEADVHCPACTDLDAVLGYLYRSPFVTPERDEHGIALDLVDWEDNPVHPVFSTDEPEFTHCSDCGEPL